MMEDQQSGENKDDGVVRFFRYRYFYYSEDIPVGLLFGKRCLSWRVLRIGICGYIYILSHRQIEQLFIFAPYVVERELPNALL